MINRAERARSLGEVAEDYGRLRPSPPDATVDWLLQRPGGPAAAPAVNRAVDLAAGTGLLTRALARLVPEVVAIEPDERMAAVLRASSATPQVGVVQRARSRMVELPEAAAFGKSENASFRYTRTMTVPDFPGLLAPYGRIITADVAADAGRARAYLAQRFPGATELEVPLHAWTWRARRT